MKKSPDLITAEGNFVYYDNIYATNVQLSDIFQHIFNIRRYLGAIDVKLGLHLTLCAELVESLSLIPLAFSNNDDPILDNLVIQKGYAGIHDFHEYIVTDVPSGLKPYLPDYREIEELAEDHVHRAIGLPLLHRNINFVKYIDQLALAIEMKYFKHHAATRVNKTVKKTYEDSEELTLFLLDSGKSILDKYDKLHAWTKIDSSCKQYLSNVIARAKLELNTQLETK